MHLAVCAICTDNLLEDETPLTALVCGHIFHVRCCRTAMLTRPTCPICSTPHESLLKAVYISSATTPSLDEATIMQARIDRLLARCEATEGFQDDYRRLQQDLRDAHQHTLSLVAGSQRDAIWNEKERAEAASRLAGPLKEVARLRELVRRYDSALARASHLTTSEMFLVTILTKTLEFDVFLPSDGAFLVSCFPSTANGMASDLTSSFPFQQRSIGSQPSASSTWAIEFGPSSSRIRLFPFRIHDPFFPSRSGEALCFAQLKATRSSL
ncbi:hypothetical protein BDY24DRAFT_436867 [Mrakia frigida]|uniref:RING finger protein n=1 Tax=Mrakia frigida TaxID=29902 RepID=UPI003FCC1AC9